MIELRDASERLVLDFAGYGSRRVTQALRRSGWLVNHQRVLRVMRDEALLCQLQRRLVGTTAATHAYRTSPNLLAGAALDSTGSTRPARLDRLDQAWVADIPAIRLPTTFVSLACVLEAFARRCSGWQLSRPIATSLTWAALARASDRRQPRRGLIQHADRGVQDASTQ